MGKEKERVVDVELDYRLEEGDLVSFLDYHCQSSEALREIRRGQMYGYAILFAAFALVYWFFGETAVGIAFLVLGPAWAAWWPARARRLAREQAAAFYAQGPNAQPEGSYTLKLDDEELLLRSSASDARLPLTSIERIVETPDYLFIYVGSIRALIVPRRRVTRGDVTAFAAELRHRDKRVK